MNAEKVSKYGISVGTNKFLKTNIEKKTRKDKIGYIGIIYCRLISGSSKIEKELSLTDFNVLGISALTT
ncbi:hypothetical protein ACE1TG_04375 [Virgibacillus sp. JSM 102003]